MEKREQKNGGLRSLKNVFFRYTFIMIFIVLLLSTIAVKVCSSLREQIIASHAYIYKPIKDPIQKDTSSYSYGYQIPGNTSNQKESVDSSDHEVHSFSKKDKLYCQLLEFLMVALPFLFLCTGIWISGSVFYSRKLKKAFHLLYQGITHIEQGDLDFSLQYSEQDELGELCTAFEIMRQKVVEKNTEMWNMVDERKKLNASVAHDLRTPITVIKGYSEYLMRNLKNNIVPQEKQEEILLYIQNAAERLEAYADSVHHIHMLENIDLQFDDVELSLFCAEMTSDLKVIAKNYKRKISVFADLPERKVCISTIAVYRILENIVKNACYYSKQNIFVKWEILDEEYFTITIRDDGKGFPEQSMHKVFRPYYKETGKENHYGMGLTISKILAEKHGGNIFLRNVSGQGAEVFVKLKFF